MAFDKNTVIKALEDKARSSYIGTTRMPQLGTISKLLTELGIEHVILSKTLKVKARTRNVKEVVDDAHNLKRGHVLIVGDLIVDTTIVDYRYKSKDYAIQLLQIIKNHERRN